MEDNGVVVEERALRCSSQILRAGQSLEVLDETLHELDAEVVSEQLHEACQSLQTMSRKRLGVGQILQDGAQTRLKELARKARGMGRQALQAIARRILDRLMGRIERLEIHTDDSERMLVSMPFEERSVRTSGGSVSASRSSPSREEKRS